MDPAMFRQTLPVAIVFVVSLSVLTLARIPLAGSLSVVLALGAMALVLRRDGDGAASVGLARPQRPWRLPAIGLGAALLGYAAAIAAMLLATRGFGWPPSDHGRFAAVAGDPAKLAGYLAVAWTTAAFGEEVLFRGFLQSRLRAMFGATLGAGALAVLVQAAVFGLAHAYQGPTGMLVTATLGAVFGALMLRLRNVWPLVLAHGLVDTASLVAVYARALPTG
jgi:uncharacterized protein